MLLSNDGMWNTGALHHNHAALLKVRALAPSSELCFKFMTRCAMQTPSSQSCSTFEDEMLAPKSNFINEDLLAPEGVRAII
jgi:hypothetical protein